MSDYGKWIAFPEIVSSTKTKRFRVLTKDGATALGEIRFYTHWRKFAFYPNPETLYEQDCLRDIANFCEVQTAAWRAAKKAEAKLV